jgi:hypothetical protein
MKNGKCLTLAMGEDARSDCIRGHNPLPLVQDSLRRRLDGTQGRPNAWWGQESLSLLESAEGSSCSQDLTWSYLELMNPVPKLTSYFVKIPFMLSSQVCLHLIRGTVVVEALCYKPEGRGFGTRWCEWISSIYLNLPAALDPGLYSASNRICFNSFISNQNYSDSIS